MQPLQTENARLSLVSKLIQLGRMELALGELKLLKGRLQRSMGNGIVIDDSKEEKRLEMKATAAKLSLRMKGPGKENRADVDPKAESEDFSTLLEFSHISASSSAFPLVISYQLAMLRCIAGLKRPDFIDVGVHCPRI
jgi:separase